MIDIYQHRSKSIYNCLESSAEFCQVSSKKKESSANASMKLSNCPCC